VWRDVRDIAPRIGLGLGPLLFLGALVLDALSLQQLGLPIWMYQAVGGAIFFVSGSSIIFSQRREIRELRWQLDRRNREQAALNRLGQLLDIGNELLQQHEMEDAAWTQWQEQLQMWTDETHGWIRDHFSDPEAARFRNARRGGSYRWVGARTDQHGKLNLLHARLEVVHEIIASYSRPA
jgi:hypothetical protein